MTILSNADIGQAMAVVRSLAAKAGIKTEQAIILVDELQARESANQVARRATEDERAKIDAYLNSLNGELSELSPADIVEHSGVIRKQGTSGYARRQKMLLLTQR